MNIQDKTDVEKCLPNKGDKVTYCNLGILEFSNGNGIIHKSITQNLQDYELFHKSVHLTNQNNEISIFLTFLLRTDTGYHYLGLDIDLLSFQDVVDFKQNHRDFKFKKMGWK